MRSVLFVFGQRDVSVPTRKRKDKGHVRSSDRAVDGARGIGTFSQGKVRTGWTIWAIKTRKEKGGHVSAIGHGVRERDNVRRLHEYAGARRPILPERPTRAL